TAAHGSVSVSGGVVTYAPSANYNGPDSFSYTITDGAGGTSSSTVSVTVTAVNEPPVANAETAATAEDPALTLGGTTLTGNDTDIDSFPTRRSSDLTAAHGSVSVSGGVVTYAPSANYNGPDSFSYTITDGAGGTSSSTVSVTVTAVN